MCAWGRSRNLTFMRHKFLVPTAKKWLKLVYIYYQIRTEVSFLNYSDYSNSLTLSPVQDGLTDVALWTAWHWTAWHLHTWPMIASKSVMTVAVFVQQPLSYVWSDRKKPHLGHLQLLAHRSRTLLDSMQAVNDYEQFKRLLKKHSYNWGCRVAPSDLSFICHA